MRIYSAQITKHFSLFRDEKVLNLWAQTEEAHCVYIQYTGSFLLSYMTWLALEPLVEPSVIQIMNNVRIQPDFNLVQNRHYNYLLNLIFI